MAEPAPPPNPPQLAQKPPRAVTTDAPRPQIRNLECANLARSSLHPAPED